MIGVAQRRAAIQGELNKRAMKKMTRSWSRMRVEEKVSASSVARRGILLGTIQVQEGTQKEMWLL